MTPLLDSALDPPLTTTRQPAPSSFNVYSYLPFKNSKFLVVSECNKEYQTQYGILLIKIV